MRLKYIGGYPNLPGPKIYEIIKKGNSIEFKQGRNVTLRLPIKYFRSGLAVGLQKENSFSGKRAFAGGIGGAILAGPIGALIGAAATGIKSKNTISVPIKDDRGNFYVLYFEGSDTNYQQLVSMIKL